MYAFINKMRLIYPIPLMCRTLSVSKSGYYTWFKRPPSKKEIENRRLAIEIKVAHKRTKATFGPYRLQRELLSHGIQVGIYRIRRIRKMLGIQCKQVKKFKATTDSKHSFPVADNLLNQNLTVDAPNKVWVSDITYISTRQGWLYLVTHKDLFNGEIVGYAMDSRMTQDLVKRSLLMAVNRRKPAPRLIHHSDRGSQYCANSYQRLLEFLNIIPSMSRKGNCYDNAPMESFFGTLKNELIYHRKYATRKEAIKDITDYIEIFYNRQRLQERLGYLSPVEFLKEFYAMRMAA